MDKIDFKGKRVLVLGASSGLGRELALQLAQKGAFLLLAARRLEKLLSLAEEIKALGTESKCFRVDVTTPQDLERLFTETTETQGVDHLVLCAGVTYYGTFLKQSQASLFSILRTNIEAFVELCRLFAPYLRTRPERAGILIVSSMASFQPLPYQAVYGASKAFISSFGRAITLEFEGNPTVTVFTPGGMATEMMESSGLSKKFGRASPFVMNPTLSARQALRDFSRRKEQSIPGFINRIGALVFKLLPAGWSARLLKSQYRNDFLS